MMSGTFSSACSLHIVVTKDIIVKDKTTKCSNMANF